MLVSSKSNYFGLNSSKNYELPNILLFDLNVYGHHPGYIRHLVKYWCKQELSGTLNVVVSPQFMQLHSDIINLALEYGKGNVNFVPISSEEDAIIQSQESILNRAVRAFHQFKLLCQYAKKLKATQCLIMYFDSLQLPLALGEKPPCPVSGIYFRPVFHYSKFANFKPSWREYFWQLRDKFFLSRILRNSYFQSLLCLDPLVVDYIGQFNPEVKAIHLPDPVKINNYTDSHLQKLRENLGIQPNRKIFLMFGAFRPRKGIYQLLDAVALLPSHLCQNLCLLLVGTVGSEKLVQTQIAEISKSLPVQFINQDKFIPEQEMQSYFQIADVILAPYQRHIGMSGILLQAAAAQKPVISSNYGLMGEIVKRYSLGITVESTIPTEITKGLTQLLVENPTDCCDFSQMKEFAKQNSADKFASTVFQYI